MTTLTVGLIDLEESCQSDLSRINGEWNLVQLTTKPSRSKPRKTKTKLGELDAVVVIGCHPTKFRCAREALSLGKHVMADFPPGRTWEEVLQLRELAKRKGVRLYSPNLLKTEPGMIAFRNTVGDPSSKLMSLTVSCNSTARGEAARSMKLIQLLDLVEWIAGARSIESHAQKSLQVAAVSAHVMLLAHKNGVKTLLNLRSTDSPSLQTFWLDGVFDNSIMHLDTRRQSILVERLNGNTVSRVDWAEPALKPVLKDFVNLIESGSDGPDFISLERIFELTRKLA